MKLLVLAIVVEMIILVWMYHNQKPKKVISTQDETSPEDGSVDSDKCWELSDLLPIFLTGTAFMLGDVLWGVGLILLK